MQRRHFLQSTLVLGATAMLTDIGLTCGNLPQDATQLQNNNADTPPQFSLGIGPQGFPIDLSVTLESKRGISVTLRYDEKTMNAPEVLEKRIIPQNIAETEPALPSEDLPPLISLVAYEPRLFRPYIYFKRGCHNYWFPKGGIVEEGTPFDEQYESVIQDIFDNLDVGDVIPEKHYKCIAGILARVYREWVEATERRRRRLDSVLSLDDDTVLSQEEVEALLMKMKQKVE